MKYDYSAPSTDGAGCDLAIGFDPGFGEDRCAEVVARRLPNGRFCIESLKTWPAPSTEQLLAAHLATPAETEDKS